MTNSSRFALALVGLLLLNGCIEVKKNRPKTPQIGPISKPGPIVIEQVNLDEILAGMGLSSLAPSEEPSGVFTANADAKAIISHTQPTQCDPFDENVSLDPRLKVGQKAVERSSSYLSVLSMYTLSSSRTEIEEIDLTKNEMVKSIYQLGKNGEDTSWRKYRCSVESWSLKCVEIETSIKDNPSVTKPTEQEISDSMKKIEICVFKASTEVKSESSEFGEYALPNGTVVSARKVLTSTPGSSVCKKDDAVTREVPSTQTKIEILTSDVPLMDRPLTCHGQFPLYTLKKVIGQNEELFDYSLRDTLEVSL